ncbi:hypothetical protein V7968_02480 [Nocardia vulneris]|uniref:hypothetical protein n=1 Tax=Nocardia vulneris TaxID=1141657 RepID=UPI0030CD08F4
MTRYPTTPPDDEDSWKWLDPPHPAPQLHVVPGHQSGPGLDERDEPSSREDRWLLALPDPSDATDTVASPAWWGRWRHRLPGWAWAALGTTIAILGGVLAITATDTGGQVHTTAPPASPTTTTTTQGPCTGLSGTVVTDGPGDPATVAGIIAAFETAYYLHRDAEKAMALLAPETGITADRLATGIAGIPAGTRHCVSITLISPSTANVHIAELHPDHTRIDYLQLINTRPADPSGIATALLISNIQRQG